MFPLLPALVVRSKGWPEIVNWPPLAWKVGLAVPPMVRFPDESSARITLVVPAFAWTIGGRPCKSSEFAAKATVASCCLGVSSGVVLTVTPRKRAEFEAKSHCGIAVTFPSNTENIPSWSGLTELTSCQSSAEPEAGACAL